MDFQVPLWLVSGRLIFHLSIDFPEIFGVPFPLLNSYLLAGPKLSSLVTCFMPPFRGQTLPPLKGSIPKKIWTITKSLKNEPYASHQWCFYVYCLYYIPNLQKKICRFFLNNFGDDPLLRSEFIEKLSLEKKVKPSAFRWFFWWRKQHDAKRCL